MCCIVKRTNDEQQGIAACTRVHLSDTHQQNLPLLQLCCLFLHASSYCNITHIHHTIDVHVVVAVAVIVVVVCIPVAGKQATAIHCLHLLVDTAHASTGG